MKTTIEVGDALFYAVMRVAAECKLTFKAVVELALRQHLDRQTQARPRLRRHTFRGCGLRPGLRESDWTAIHERAYEGRGG